jgi:hypothetical protein
MTMIRNPILPGFNPDPSICRVGDDYYIATSTFEWYPGVQIPIRQAARSPRTSGISSTRDGPKVSAMRRRHFESRAYFFLAAR